MFHPQKTFLLLLLISFSSSRMIIPDENDELRSPSFLDRDLLDELNGEKPPWKDEEMKLYMQKYSKKT